MARPRERPGEFALIERYFKPLATDPGAFGLIDDIAVLKPPRGANLVLKTDLIAEGVHFFADDPPAAIARKALRVNLSDLASKGATPIAYLLSLALRGDWDEAWVRGFAAGLTADQKRYGMSLMGGDTSRASGGMTISVAMVGSLPKGRAITRAGAKAGNVVLVSGTVGDAALGLRLRLGQVTAPPRDARQLLARYLVPEPRLALGPAIRRYAASAMDISDGLVGDFKHICDASGVSGTIDASAVPLSPAARRMVAGDPRLMETVLTGGDDYEVLVTVAPRDVARYKAVAARSGVPVTAIGRVTKGRGGPTVVDGAGKALALTRRSFDHFAAKA